MPESLSTTAETRQTAVVRTTRVLWLIKGLGPGGAERLLVSVARVGDRSTFRYEVAYLLPDKTTFVPDLEALGVVTRCFGRPGRDLAWPWRLRRLIRDGGYDVVHLHSPLLAGVARVLVKTLPRSRRPAVVSTEHNVWDSYRRPTRLLNAALHRTDRHRWAVSGRVRESMGRVSRRGVDVLTHGIVLTDIEDLVVDRARVRRELQLGPQDVVAITVANFRPEKAYPDLLEAAALALRQAPELRLLIVGQGPQRELIERLHADLGLGDGCRILGYRPDVLSLLAACDFLVISSHFEGFPIALMEAMAVGLPVVATSVGGVPDAVHHGVEGLLVEPGATEDLAAAMVRMTRERSERHTMAAKARARGASYDIRGAVGVLERAYADLAESRPVNDSRASRPAARRGRRG